MHGSSYRLNLRVRLVQFLRCRWLHILLHRLNLNVRQLMLGQLTAVSRLGLLVCLGFGDKRIMLLKCSEGSLFLVLL